MNNRSNKKYRVNDIRRGDIIYAVLNGVPKSSVQKGERPCLVLSNNKSNQFSSILNVYPLIQCTQKQKKLFKADNLEN